MGFLMRVYRNMQSRVEGIQRREAHHYEGLPILPRTDFYAWSVGDGEFNRLWIEWQAAKRDKHLTPSIDRKDVSRGYVFPNMRWRTHAENSGDLTRRDNTTRIRGDAWYKAHFKQDKHESC